MLAIVGHTTRDVVDGGAPRPGGAPIYAARALRVLGEPALIVTRCAAEDEGLLAPLRATGLRVVWRPEAASASFRLLYRNGVREVEIEALGEPFSPEDARGWLGRALREADWVHLGALWRGDFPAETISELAGRRRVSFDGQGLVRQARLGPVQPDAELDRGLLAAVNVLHLSVDEAGALGLRLGERSLGKLGVGEVVVTLGAEGSLVYANGRTERVPARPVASADPTGAGDAFMAVYLASRRRGHSPASAARRATAVVHGLLTGALR
jgi:sugar/nucleoside kinase (ribokinase family)